MAVRSHIQGAKSVFTNGVHVGAGAMKEAQRRLGNPENIPYNQLHSLESIVNPKEELSVTALFLPSSDTTSSQLSSLVDDLNTQTAQITSYHIYLDASSQLLDILPPTVSASLPEADDSHYTLLLPISSGSLTLGPTTLKYLLHLAGTREFSGALLELGCHQLGLVQTTWLDKIDMTISNTSSEIATPSYRARLVTSIKVPIVEKQDAIDGFWAHGLRDCSSYRPDQYPPATNPNASRVVFMVEKDEQDGEVLWYGGWKDLVCEFATKRKAQWNTEVLLFDGSQMNHNQLWCDDGLAVNKRSIDKSQVGNDVLSLGPGVDVMLYALDGFVDSELKRDRGLLGLEQKMAVIGLPREDLGHALWISALSSEALSSKSPIADLAPNLTTHCRLEQTAHRYIGYHKQSCRIAEQADGFFACFAFLWLKSTFGRQPGTNKRWADATAG